MNQEDLMIHIFCLIDDLLKAMRLPRLRQRGPDPVLSDSEALAIVCLGEFLGLDADKAIYGFCREHFAHLFPGLGQIGRTTFTRQAANLWKLGQLLQERLAEGFVASRPDGPLWLIDSFPLPACRFARAPSCKRLAGVASFGFDHTIGAVFYGVRIHLRCADCGVVVKLQVAPANVHDVDVAPEMLGPGADTSLADRNYWSPPLQEQLRIEGRRLLTPFRLRAKDKHPAFTALLSKLRQPIEPLIGQLAVRLNAKRTWARDLWHLVARLTRKVLAHTLAVVLNDSLGNPPTQLELLMAA